MREEKGNTISIKGNDKLQINSKRQPVIKATKDSSDQEHEKKVDLVFVIDTTGSMSDKIEGLLGTCAQFVDEFAGLKINHQIAIISFGDLYVPNDRIEFIPFTNNINSVKYNLKKITRNDGGGNEGESSLEAVEKAINLSYRTRAVKVVILITDEPAHQHNISPNFINEQLHRNEFLVFVISPPFSYFQEMARKNGGTWREVKSDTKLADILDMFRGIAKKVQKTVIDVHTLGDGSVSTFLLSRPPDD